MLQGVIFWKRICCFQVSVFKVADFIDKDTVEVFTVHSLNFECNSVLCIFVDFTKWFLIL